MTEFMDTPPRSTRETVLRILVLGGIYALAVVFVVALSPSMGLVTPHPTGEVGRVAEAPGAAHR
jgi:hypothetical protein